MKKSIPAIFIFCILTFLVTAAFPVLAESVTMEKPVLNVPQIKEANKAYIIVVSYTVPGAIKTLDDDSKASVYVQAEIRINGGEWKLLSTNFNLDGSYEINPRDVGAGAVIDIKSAFYETRARFAYRRSGEHISAYSEYSDIVSIGTPAFYKDASDWATTELNKAGEYGLIPNILKGADMTKPITREEFCELAVLLYEKTTGKASTSASPNPFTDTTNVQILKAFKLGITDGTSSTTFTPQKLISREECATMLFRAIKAIAPTADYNVNGVADFPDQMDISAWALDGAKYMFKLGIIRGGNGGKFMPKAITTAQEAEGYGRATREAAILMSVRTYEKFK